MSRLRPVVYTQEFKLSAVQRMAAGANVVALARELGVLRKSLYAWRDQLRVGGPEALQVHRRGPKPKLGCDSATGEPSPLVDPFHPVARSASAPSDPPPARPPDRSAVAADGAALAAARQRIGELEQKIGRQALELDFFRNALQHIRAARWPNTGPGATASMPSSDR
jgi:hypothetical protein